LATTRPRLGIGPIGPLTSLPTCWWDDWAEWDDFVKGIRPLRGYFARCVFVVTAEGISDGRTAPRPSGNAKKLEWRIYPVCKNVPIVPIAPGEWMIHTTSLHLNYYYYYTYLLFIFTHPHSLSRSLWTNCRNAGPIVPVSLSLGKRQPHRRLGGVKSRHLSAVSVACCDCHQASLTPPVQLPHRETLLRPLEPLLKSAAPQGSTYPYLNKKVHPNVSRPTV
jgi:hypothetical protein